MYAKVFQQIFDGTLCTKGPWQALVTFQQLLILADPDGCVDMTAAAISRRTTIPLEIIEAGLPALMAPDQESRTPTEEGRRLVALAEGRPWGWRIVNYKQYRDLKREEDRREYHREYWHKRKLKDSTETQQAQQNQPKKERVDKRQKQVKKPAASSSPGAIPPSVTAWTGYSLAYELRYSIKPVVNAKARGIMAQFVSRIPHEEAGAVAAFYVRHNNQLYINAHHPPELLLRDAESLRTQMMTGKSNGSADNGETPRARALRKRAAEMTGGLMGADPRQDDGNIVDMEH